MKSLLKTFVVLATVAMFTAASQATVNISLNAGVLYQADGTTPLDLGSTVVLLADVDNDGDFGDLTDPTSFDGGGESQVLFRLPTNDALFDQDFNNAAGTFAGGDGAIDFTGLQQNLQLLLVWYDLPFDGGATGPGEGVNFGTHRQADWLLPADGGTLSSAQIAMETGVVFGSLPESAGITDQTTVPEPASLALLGLGGLLIARRRK